jgi:hypothetical protein
MHVDEQQILSLSREIWASHLGLNVLPEGPEVSGERKLASCIEVSGPWHGAIVLECPESIARHAAAMLFASDGEATPEEEIEDALKELAQLVGQKFRTLLPEAAELSRPAIVMDVAGSDALSGMHGLTELTVNCEGRPVRIALYEGEPNLAAAGS